MITDGDAVRAWRCRARTRGKRWSKRRVPEHTHIFRRAFRRYCSGLDSRSWKFPERFQNPPSPKCIIALILVKGGRQEANHPVVTIRLVHEAAPVVCPIGARVRAQLGVSVGTKGQSRSHAYEDEGRVVKAVLRCEYEGLPERWRGRNGTGTHGAKIRHDTENPLRLLLCRINVALVDRLAWSIRQIRRCRSRR